MGDEKVKLSWLDYVKLLFKGKKILDTALSEGKAVKEIAKKSSWKSTEFWTAALAGLGAILAQAGGLIPPPYGAIGLSVSAALYSISRGLAKQADPTGGVKPGMTTTEFWLNILTQIGIVAAATSGAVDPQTAATLMLISNGAYGLSRGLAKGGTQPDETDKPEPAKPL